MWQYNHTSNLMHSAYADRPYYAVEYSDDLYHYGVLGMKWGIRKERPSSGTGRGRGRKKLTAKQKKLIKNIAIGTTIGGTVALAGGALALQSHNQLSKMGGIRGLKNAKQAYRLATGGKRVGINTLGRDAVAANRQMGITPGGRVTSGSIIQPGEITRQRNANKAVQKQIRQYERFERGQARASMNSPEAVAARKHNRIANSRGYQRANTTSQGYSLNLTTGGYAANPRRQRARRR